MNTTRLLFSNLTKLETNQDIFDKLAEAENLSADEIIIPITFEPFSYLIVQEMKELRSRIEVCKLYESISPDERSECINQNSIAQTVMFPNHKTNDEFWPETKEMALALNEVNPESWTKKLSGFTSFTFQRYDFIFIKTTITQKEYQTEVIFLRFNLLYNIQRRVNAIGRVKHPDGGIAVAVHESDIHGIMLDYGDDGVFLHAALCLKMDAGGGYATISKHFS